MARHLPSICKAKAKKTHPPSGSPPPLQWIRSCAASRGGRSQTCTTQSHHRDQESRRVPEGARGVLELLAGEQRELSPAQ